MTAFSDGAVVGLCYGKMGTQEGREERVGERVKRNNKRGGDKKRGIFL